MLRLENEEEDKGGRDGDALIVKEELVDEDENIEIVEYVRDPEEGIKIFKEEQSDEEDKIRGEMKEEQLDYLQGYSLAPEEEEDEVSAPSVCESENTRKGQKKSSTRKALRENEVRVHKCEECSKTFRTPWRLNQHRITHSSETPFQCDKCGKMFKRIDSLNLHRLTHTDINAFECDLCDAKLKTKANLNQHKTVRHARIKSFECDECGNKFKRPADLRMHKATHADVRPFECEKEGCKQSFKTKTHLTKHQRIHTGIRPFRCDQCDKTFIRRYHLKLHTITHSEGKPYKCDLCEIAFKFKTSVALHVKLKHR